MSIFTNRTNLSEIEVDALVNLYNQRRLVEAAILGEDLAKEHPHTSLIYDVLGAVYMGLKNSTKSIESYQKLLQLEPNHTDAFNNMAWASMIKADLMKQ